MLIEAVPALIFGVASYLLMFESPYFLATTGKQEAPAESSTHQLQLCPALITRDFCLRDGHERSDIVRRDMARIYVGSSAVGDSTALGSTCRKQ
eukprot:678798-Amphidinium_carterae.1